MPNKQGINKKPLMCAVLACCVVMTAQAKGNKGQPRRVSEPTLVEQAELASRVAGYAKRQSDALAWLVASRLMREGAPGARDGNGQPVFQQWLERASVAAGGDPRMQELIADAKVSGHRGLVDGPKQTIERLGSRQSKVYTLTFAGDADAAVAVLPLDGIADQGASAPDLDLYVSDDRGLTICSSESPGMPEICRWSPRRTGKFQIRIENRTSSTASFSLLAR